MNTYTGLLFLNILISNHCKPVGNVLVLASGACGEVMGAVEAGCNVVCVRKDEK